jgi:trimethylamine---corrinoid protein Co-methyltransferase
MRRGTNAGGLRHAAAGLCLLTDSELAEIERASLQVLERTGVWVEADDALDVFADGGCRVDRESHIVKIPGWLVEDALAATPPTFRVCGRDPRNDVVLGGDGVHFMNFGMGLKVTDRASGANRDSIKSDVADCARLVDWCSEIDVLLEAVVPHDYSPPALHILDANLRNCTKPSVCGPGSAAEAEACLDLLAAVYGSRDTFAERSPVIMGACTVSPLQLTREGTTAWLAGARAGLPIVATQMPMAGGSGPQTLAGTLVVGDAEVLAAAVLVQLANRGNPFLYSSSNLAMDLRLAAAVLGTPEAALLNAAVAQLARFHGMPTWVQGL